MNKEVIMIRDIKRMQNATAVIFLLIGVELGGWGGYILADSRPRSVAYVDVQQVDRVAGTREIAWEKFLPVMPSLLDVGTGLFGNTTVAPIPDFAADFTVDVCAGPDLSRATSRSSPIDRAIASSTCRASVPFAQNLTSN